MFRDESYIDTALICENGHVINSSMRTYPVNNTEYCKECGAKTISECKYCGTEIQGNEFIPGMMSIGYEHPKFCHQCGKPYPWTELEIQSARELIELTGLQAEEKEAFKDAIGNIITDTPKTKAATAKIKFYLGKVGDGLRNDIKDVIATIGTEVALEAMGLKQK